MLTPEQLQQIRDIVEKYHSKIAIGMADDIELAYLYGQILSQTNDPEIHKKSLEEIKQAIKQAKAPLSVIEQQAMVAAKMSAGQYLKGLENRVQTRTGQMALETDAYIRAVRQTTADAVEERKTITQLASDLGHATGDWDRDLKRVAVTELQTAMDRGWADSTMEEFGGDALVFKRPSPDCCKHCDRLYLEADGFTPKVFELSELEANGTNHGRKAADWLPTVGPVHPNCGCALNRLPDHFGFDENGQMKPKTMLDVSEKSQNSDRYVIPLKKALVKEIALAGKGKNKKDPGPSGINLETGVERPDHQSEAGPELNWIKEFINAKETGRFNERDMEEFNITPEPHIQAWHHIKEATAASYAGVTDEEAEENKSKLIRRQETVDNAYGTYIDVEMDPATAREQREENEH